jgi:hypothetical protein
MGRTGGTDKDKSSEVIPRQVSSSGRGELKLFAKSGWLEWDSEKHGISLADLVMGIWRCDLVLRQPAAHNSLQQTLSMNGPFLTGSVVRGNGCGG